MVNKLYPYRLYRLHDIRYITTPQVSYCAVSVSPSFPFNQFSQLFSVFRHFQSTLFNTPQALRLTFSPHLNQIKKSVSIFCVSRLSKRVGESLWGIHNKKSFTKDLAIVTHHRNRVKSVKFRLSIREQRNRAKISANFVKKN
jgi:hypothetical protein